MAVEPEAFDTDPRGEALESEITLETIVEQQIDESTRTIYFFEAIERDLTRRIIPSLRFLAEESDERITLVCGSPGGTEASMFALADAIDGLDVPVDLYAYGELSSAATVLFAVCDRRYVSPNCCALLHAFTGSIACAEPTGQELLDSLEGVRIAAQRWAKLMGRCAHPDALPYDLLYAIAMGSAGEQKLTGAELVSVRLADAVLPSRGPTVEERQMNLPLGKE